MSVQTTAGRNAGTLLKVPPSQKCSSLSAVSASSRPKLLSKPDTSQCENHDPSQTPASKIRDINSTYVISACNRSGDLPLSPNPVGRLTLQRRATRNKESTLLGSELGDTIGPAADASLTLQRRGARTDCVERWRGTQKVAGEAGLPQETGTNAKVLSSNRNPSVTSSASFTKDSSAADEKRKEMFSTPGGTNENAALKSSSRSVPIHSQGQTRGHSAGKPLQSKAGSVQHGSTGNVVASHSNTLGSLEKRPPVPCTPEHKSTPKRGLPLPESPGASTVRSRGPSLQRSQSSLLANKRDMSQENTLLPEGTTSVVNNSSTKTDPFKVENSQVTVAVRVRPLSKREQTEKAFQVVFMNGEEVTVEHPDLRRVYAFTYDVSFWSFDDRHPHYASQPVVYERLAAPLLERAFEGFNACLFAYGQTGSGKSYTMMGFSEELGIIPRFCEDLFAQVAKKQTQEVSYHLEMSFFEVYNEKIHDLLVCKGDNGQRKQPLRVREHPVTGPYVEGLSMNVVSSYSDIQSWLELGNKQRATAATGMNDKSSRSHSVFTLVMTQTKTEFVEGEEHDHRITSRINLIDLAGSERCSTAQTSGDRLKEGVSINKSLLTLGKVISALSEQANRRRVFVPYRESVLTWLLKESLGGNSKTAMIATVSPASSNLEETLSTLRYASQARLIVNVAKVNEDVNARLIRELKAEIEKLKAAQRSNRNIDPERYRLCQQEITSLRMKLHQQERDMAEMQRVWKEKLEQAEKRKLQETKELQKAGITFQMDNHLPNLVNLNEDPQLSEMLLYMIKEGTTTVGKCRPHANHDIQLSGVLIADDHCTIKNLEGTVSVIPIGEAKTYVNGRHILQPTVLHHGDRVILGGDHYFRFNHPVEVHKGRRPSNRDTLASEAPKDFEFAKNELLVAQRSQALAPTLGEGFELELDHRLCHQLRPVKKALADHSIRHAKILEALEAEKQKIAKELQILQQNQSNRDKLLAVQPNWSSMKLSVMIQEANTISSKLKKHYAFGRHDASDKGRSDTSIRVRDLRLGISTVWSVEKFESKLAAMKELYESNGVSRGDDVFCDPEDEWEPDITNTSVSSLSRRRSRCLLKNRRISGCLQDLQVHPTPNLRPSPPAGLMERSSSICSHSTESLLPGICKELIGSSIDFLGQNYDEEKSIADSLMSNLLKIYTVLLAISKAHEEQDEESQENLFSLDRAAQSLAVQITCAFDQLVVLLKHWWNECLPCPSIARLEDELRQEIKSLGGYLQLFLQGCCSDISSMVKEAQRKVKQVIQQAVKYVGQLAVLKGSKLCFLDNRDNQTTGVQGEFMDAVCDGVGSGMKILLDSGLEKAEELEQELSRQWAQHEVTKQMKASAVGLIRSLGDTFSEWKTKSFRAPGQEDCRFQNCKKMVHLAPELLKLTHCLEKTIQMVISALRGMHNKWRDAQPLRSLVEDFCSVAGRVHCGLGELLPPLLVATTETPGAGLGDLEALAKSLLLCFESEERLDLSKAWKSHNQSGGGGEAAPPSRPGHSRGVPKHVYQLHAAPPELSAEWGAPGGIQWV
ncbi:PREDICTED: kinesin-like protein KIF14 [Dipodomys ordii]|uniref:Kinesin-like protein KIF14 n=1 Tax=Dipodomys ordii TaxID=10020 RepID=A0A1S3F907_DIPOR|nr:PREDICTED: kinesin-like protein KIF14 [Dipodomys ordii]